jgi:hypothetical protein
MIKYKFPYLGIINYFNDLTQFYTTFLFQLINIYDMNKLFIR